MLNQTYSSGLCPHLLAVAVLLGAGASSVSAQAGDQAVVVAIPETFPSLDARAIVMRHGDRDVILLRESDATAEALAMSLSVLERAKERTVAPGRGELIPIIGFALEAPLAARTQARLEEALARLTRQPLSSIGSFGPGRWIRYRAR